MPQHKEREVLKSSTNLPQQQHQKRQQQQHKSDGKMLFAISEIEADDYERSFIVDLAAGGDSQLNSTFIAAGSSSSCCSSNSNSSSQSLTPASAKTISQKPSDGSKHFENTYKLLGKQLESNCQRAVDKLQQLSKSSDQIEDSLSSCYSSMSAIVNSTEPPPTRLELELEAVERLRLMVRQINANSNSNSNCSSGSSTSAPLLALLHDFAAKSQGYKVGSSSPATPAPSPATSGVKAEQPPHFELPEQLLQSAESWQLMYYASKNVDGQNCLKVVRSLLTNKVLCGNRVSQMTRAYDDIEAVTRLLEEKEKDLELTVQIGKELLTQNNALEARVADLEADLKSSNDDRAQLLHELHKKSELIAVLTNDAEDTGSEADTPTLSKSITLDLLQRKVNSLLDENKSLKCEATQLAHETDEVEAQERRLMADISAQLSDTNSQFENLNLELERQREENRLQHEQIVSLTARLAEAEMRLHQISQDNDENMSMLHITKENQNALALELVEFKQRYEEVLALLHSAQDQLKQQRKRTQPRSSFLGGVSGGGMLQPESLQSELMESSMYSENSLDSGISADSQRAAERISRMMSQLPGGVGSSMLGGGHSIYGSAGGVGVSANPQPYQRIFDTVRCASKGGNFMDSGNVSMSMSQLGAMSMSSASGPRMASMANAPAGSYYRGSNAGLHRTLSSESLNSQSDDGYPAQPSGVPGAPGAKELEAALKRLTPAEVLARRAMLSYAPVGTYNYDEPPLQGGRMGGGSGGLPLGVRTPDSIMSTGSSGRLSSSSASMSTTHQWRLPEKLQIVKPLEGSQTLHHWSRLATPTLSGLLEERPGVTIRGGRDLDQLGMQLYTLSDVEEDVSEDLLPGKQFEAPGCTYTFTTSMVMHPDDGFVTDLSFLSQSQMSSRMASTSTSRQSSCPATPRAGLSRKNSCSTFSVNLGLAGMLNERGIKAVTPSALNTPAGPNYTPTVTPCNSPEGSPPRCQSPEPLFGLLSSGADLIRRKLAGNHPQDVQAMRSSLSKQQQQQKVMLSRLERRALRSLKLVEKVESIGLENIISSSTHSGLGAGIAQRSSSPLSQLSLRSSHHNSIADDLHFDRAQIKGVLHRGLNSPTPAAAAPSTISSGTTSAYNSDDSDDQGIVLKLKPRGAAATTTTATTKKPEATPAATTSARGGGGGAAATASSSASETRLKQMQRQKSRRSLKNGMATQRPDLGSVAGGGRVRPDLGKVEAGTSHKKVDHSKAEAEAVAPQSITQAFVGSVSSLLFGRKGGWQ